MLFQDKSNKRKEEEKKYGIYFDDDYDYLQHLRETGKEVAHWEQAPDQKVSYNCSSLTNNVILEQSGLCS